MTNLFGLDLHLHARTLFGMTLQFNVGFYVCAVTPIAAFYLSMRISLALRADAEGDPHQPEPARLHRRQHPALLLLSPQNMALPARLHDALAGRMQWTASGEVVLTTILGGAGTLLGLVIGAGAIKYFEPDAGVLQLPARGGAERARP